MDGRGVGSWREAIGHALTELVGSAMHLRRAHAAGAQVRDTALVVAAAGIHVLRRGGDGAWRAAISLLELDP